MQSLELDTSLLTCLHLKPSEQSWKRRRLKRKRSLGNGLASSFRQSTVDGSPLKKTERNVLWRCIKSPSTAYLNEQMTRDLRECQPRTGCRPSDWASTWRITRETSGHRPN